MKKKYYISYQFSGTLKSGFGNSIQWSKGKFSLSKAKELIEKDLVAQNGIANPNVIILFFKEIGKNIIKGALKRET